MELLRRTGIVSMGFVVLMVVAAACNNASPERTRAAAQMSLDSTTIVTCPVDSHGENLAYSWPASAMNGGAESDFPREQFKSALRDLVLHNAPLVPAVFKNGEVRDSQWFVLAISQKGAAVAVGSWDQQGPGENGEVVLLKHTAAGWTPDSWGKCEVVPALSSDRGTVVIDGMEKAAPSSKELDLRITELGCSSGRDPRPYLDRPSVLENADSVKITLTVKQPDMSPLPDGTPVAYTCIGVSPFPYTVHLAHPLGDRTILDGSVWPASKVKVR